MSEETENTEAETPDDEDGEGAETPKGGLKKKLLLFGLPALILVLGGVGAAVMFLGGGDEAAQVAEGEAGEHGEDGDYADSGHDEAGKHAELTFYELPELLVNISSDGSSASVLKLKLVLEIDDPALVETLDARLPRVIDQYQTFLRELRVEDLSGSASMFRLRHELLRRVNLAVAPDKVNNVLIEEILFR